MRKTFPSYFHPSNEEFGNIWQECLFVPDANVLLDLYRYRSSTSQELLKILDEYADRLWVPYQVAFEYVKRRPNAILQAQHKYEQAKGIIQTLLTQAQNNVKKQFKSRNHPFIEDAEFVRKIRASLTEIAKELDECMKQHKDLLQNDHLLDHLSRLTEGRIGDSYSEEELKKVYENGKKRYEARVPPGYCDAEGDRAKKGTDIYGDLVLWCQTIDKAKQTKKPIIFISNEKKEDWWWKPEGRIIGPRPELIEEMKEEADVFFYMYSADRFMHYSTKYLDAVVSQGAIDEVEDVRESDAEYTVVVALPDDFSKAFAPVGKIAATLSPSVVTLAGEALPDAFVQPFVPLLDIAKAQMAATLDDLARAAMLRQVTSYPVTPSKEKPTDALSGPDEQDNGRDETG